jgi:FixJ family two-component response regulator
MVLSGYTEDEMVRHNVGAGGAAFLQKPVEIRTLTRTVRAALDAAR